MINSLKDNFGFIERADVVREIFFHVSEMNGGDSVTPHLGDDVEFTIQVGYLLFISKSEITNITVTSNFFYRRATARKSPVVLPYYPLALLSSRMSAPNGTRDRWEQPNIFI